MKRTSFAMIGTSGICLAVGMALGAWMTDRRRNLQAIKPATEDLPFMELGQVSGQLDEVFQKDFDNPDGVQTGFPPRFTLANRCFLLRARYWILFREYLDCLPVEKLGTALAEHRAFLKQEAAESTAAGKEYEGGSLEPIVAGRHSVEMYEERIALLKIRLNALGAGDVAEHL